MKNKYKVLAVVIFSAFLLPNLSVAAGFRYGSISVNPGGTQGLLTYKILENTESQLCDLNTFVCNTSVTTLPAPITGEIGPGSYTLSSSGKLAFVPEVSSSGGVLNNVYRVVDGKLSSPQTLPVATHIYRILFTTGDTHAVMRTASAIISVDLKTNTILGTAPWNSTDFFGFAQISPDGKFLAYYSSATQSSPTRYFRIVDISKGKTYTLSEKIPYWDLLSEDSILFQFSPDGKFLLYKDDRNGPQTLYKVDLAKLVKLKGNSFLGTRVFTKGYTVSDFLLTDSRTILYLANRATSLRFDLYSYDLVSGALKTVMTNASYSPTMKRSGDLVFVNQLTSWGSQVMAYNLKTGVLRALPMPSGNLTSARIGTDMTFAGGLHGSLILPDNFDAKTPHKLVIWLHGGPYRQTSLGFHPYASYGLYDWILEGMRSSGVVVLKLDYSGSFGYGRPFSESLKNNVGVKDVKDVMTALTSLKSKYAISETQFMGVSYGGYLALRALVEKPTSFSGAISINGVSDWLTLVNNNPNTIFAADFGGPLTEKNEQVYDRASIWAKLPLLGSQKITLLHSTADSDVSFSQSTKLESILKSAGKNVTLTRLEGDDHVFQKTKSAITVCETSFIAMGLDPAGKCAL